VGDLRFALRETEIGSYPFIEWAGQKSPNKAVLSQALIGLSTHEVVPFAGEQRDPDTAMIILRPEQKKNFHSSTGQKS